MTALVLKDYKLTVAILSLDVLGINSGLVAEIESQANQKLGIDSLLITSSHTHSAPSLVTTCTDRADLDFSAKVSDLSLDLLERAAKTVSVATLSKGTASLVANCNRRAYEKNRGVDRSVRVLRLNTSSQTILIVRFTCHPTCFGQTNYLASADYVGYLRKGLPGFCTIFVNGCAGYVDPSADGEIDDSGKGEEKARWLGTQLAQSVKALELSTTVNPKLGYNSRPIDFSFEPWCPGQLLVTRPGNINAIKIGETYIVGLPGEPFCESGYHIANCMESDVWVLGYTGGYFGYLIDQQAESHGDSQKDLTPSPNEFDYEAGWSNQSATRNIGYKVRAKDTGALESAAIESLSSLD